MNGYYNPVRTVEGRGCVEEIPALVKKAGTEHGRILVLAWNESVFQLQPFCVLNRDESYQVKMQCFRESNPTVGQLFELYEQTKGFSPEIIIAVGGGSVMDVGKSLCCLYGKQIHDADELRNIIDTKAYGTPETRWIGVPTTAGTGSEVTCWATIWDPEANMKRSVESQENFAYAAVVDSGLAQGMPISLAVSSALDAMAHAIEGYWAKASNLVSRAAALYAVKTIMEHMDALLEGDAEAHEYMAQGSLLAGMAFSNTKTTACHSISYPLTMQYHIPHGVAVSMLLGPVLKINQGETPRMGLIFEAAGVKNAEEFEERIQNILKKAQIPASLEEWKVNKNDLKELAALGITKGRADNNPVEITTDMIEQILVSIYPVHPCSRMK